MSLQPGRYGQTEYCTTCSDRLYGWRDGDTGVCSDCRSTAALAEAYCKPGMSEETRRGIAAHVSGFTKRVNAANCRADSALRSSVKRSTKQYQHEPGNFRFTFARPLDPNDTTRQTKAIAALEALGVKPCQLDTRAIEQVKAYNALDEATERFFEGVAV